MQQRSRVRLAPVVLLLVACVATDDATFDPTAAQDAIDGTASKADLPTCSIARCGDPDAPAILFPGNPVCRNGGACERPYLASSTIYVPPTNGKPWGDTYLAGGLSPSTIAGYSSGRHALLRRLALVGDGTAAVMIDPSYEDNARDFLGTGPMFGDDIIRAWLAADPARTFLLIYSTTSTGWQRYAALADEDPSHISVCAVATPHLLIPRIPGLAEALAAPESWDHAPCL